MPLNPTDQAFAALADDVDLGHLCAMCLCEFEGSHGHPVLCHDCYEPDIDGDELPKATLVEAR